MRSARRGWTMSESDARSTLRLIEERLRFAGIGPQHRDMLVRLREHLEDDLAACEPEPASGPAAATAAGVQAA